MNHKTNVLALSLVCCFLTGSAIAADPTTSQIKPKVKLATTDWPPYVGEKLAGFGYIYAIVTTALQTSGYAVSVQFMPWADTIQLDRNHNDGFFPQYKNNQPDLLCSDPIFGGPVALYKRSNDVMRYTVDNPGKNQANAFLALKNYRFGVVGGYINTTDFDNATYLKKVVAPDDYSNLKNLADNKVDLAFTDVFVAEYLKDHHQELANIEMMGPSLQNEDLYVCFSKNAPDVTNKLAALNRGLHQLTESGEFQAILQKYS